MACLPGYGATISHATQAVYSCTRSSDTPMRFPVGCELTLCPELGAAFAYSTPPGEPAFYGPRSESSVATRTD